MATILCLETATTNCSVALCIDGKAVAVVEENNKNFSHAEKLHIFIEQVLQQSQTPKDQLQAVAVSKGPGSYTGLRIGVSAAKGLCFALDIPLISTPTLQVLAQQVTDVEGYVVPMIDARRMEVYSAVFDSEIKQVRQTQAEIVDEHSFSAFLDKKPTVFLGDGSDKFKAICTSDNAHFLPERFPSAAEMAILAEDKFLQGIFEDVAYFEPYYLKEFISG